jgi:hypothetical protein
MCGRYTGFTEDEEHEIIHRHFKKKYEKMRGF